ncbi:MAG: hypothetical protein AB7H90_09935 [Alphaproteobacteria bacterium]
MASIAQQTLDKNKIFIERPEFLQYFYDGKDILESDEDYAKARAIALAILDFMDHVGRLTEYSDKIFPDSLSGKDVWFLSFRAAFEASPILCRTYRENRQFYGIIRRFASTACNQRRNFPKADRFSTNSCASGNLFSGFSCRR